MTALLRTPLYDLHVALGARMVPFAGYEMPVQYKDGILKEHLQVRSAAGLFDVSHMGQAALIGPDHETTARALEALIPAEVQRLGVGRQRYSVLLNDAGGILDDLIFGRAPTPGVINLVVNAACKEADYAHIAARLPSAVRLERRDDRALLALQGPAAVSVAAEFSPALARLEFMSFAEVDFGGVEAVVSRSGYTGEDGFEISLPASKAPQLARAILADPRVQPIGLGARDSLRLEAGLCLYGHDLDETTSPVEGAIGFAIGKRRRSEGGFPGAERILRELKDGPSRVRVGIRLEGRAPAREGAIVVDADGAEIGVLTSGGFGPSVGGPIAMGYVAANFSAPGTPVSVIVRGAALPARIAVTPFVEHRYFRG